MNATQKVAAVAAIQFMMTNPERVKFMSATVLTRNGVEVGCPAAWLKRFNGNDNVRIFAPRDEAFPDDDEYQSPMVRLTGFDYGTAANNMPRTVSDKYLSNETRPLYESGELEFESAYIIDRIWEAISG